MRLNILYGVLTQLLTESPEYKLLGTISPIHDSTIDNKEYYRLELPLTDLSIDGLKLQEVHISIYKNVFPNNPNLGPSHCTALFHNSLEQEFRMHIFLNRKDTLACPPTWELLDNHEFRYVKVNPPADMDSLTHLIWQHGLPCLQELRQQQKNIETRLQSNYKQLEQQSASLNRNLSKNKTAYMESIEQLISSVTLLTAISESTNWQRINTYLQRLHHSTSLIAESNNNRLEKKLTPVQKEKEENESLGFLKQISSLSQQSLFSKSGKKSESHDTAVQKQIHKIENLFNKMNKTQDTNTKALLLIDLNTQLVKIDLENEHSLTRMQIETLKHIEETTTQQAKTLLQSALLRGEYDCARILSPFYELVGSTILPIALMQKNASLLKFLVHDLGLPINSLPITIKSRTYTNAAEYCFYECQDNDSLLNCFSVLIEHEANLMQPVGPDKLPLAHMILSANPKHPLFAALEKNKSLTLSNQLFYSHLIHSLSDYLRAGPIEEDNKLDLENCIAQYRRLKSDAVICNSLLNPRNLALDKEISDIARKFFSTAMVEALLQDEEIRTENNFLSKEAKELIDQIKVFQKLTGKVFPYHSIINSANQDFKKELLRTNLQVNLGFSELKKGVLQNVSNDRSMIGYCMELIDVKTKMIHYPLVVGKKNKDFKKLDKRLKELKAKIDELDKSSSFSALKNFNEHQEELIKLKMRLSELKESRKVLSAAISKAFDSKSEQSTSLVKKN